jgi:hypothetical protein
VKNAQKQALGEWQSTQWASTMALYAHIIARHTLAFRETLLPMQGALYDEPRYKRLR